MNIETFVENISYKRKQKECEIQSRHASLRESLFTIISLAFIGVDILAVISYIVLATICTRMTIISDWTAVIFFAVLMMIPCIDLPACGVLYDRKDRKASMSDLRHLAYVAVALIAIKAIPFWLILKHVYASA